VRMIGESTGQRQFPISLDMAKEPKAEIANWLSFIAPENDTVLDSDTSTGSDDDAPKTKKKKIREE
jgi:hypothetical protein